MNLHKRRMRTVEAALQRLAKNLGPDVLFLPVEIVSEKTCGFPVACIDRFGIKLTEQCVDKDPMNIEVYIAHEVFHEVLEDESLHHLFAARVLNDGTDYKINQHLQEFYGYDVTACHFKGLRNPKYDKLTIEQICNVLPRPKGQHFTPVMRHPIVVQLAKEIRTKHGLEVKHKDFIKFKYQEAFYHELRKHYPSFEFENLPTVNPDVLVRHLWVRHYTMAQQWEHSAFQKHLTHTQALALIPKVASIDTENDAELSMFAAMFIVNALNNAHRIIRKQLNRLVLAEDSVLRRKDRLREERRHLNNKPKARQRLAEIEEGLLNVKKRLKSIKKRRKFFESLPRLPDLLRQQPSIRVRKFQPKWGCLSSAQSLKSDTPKFDHTHEFSKLVTLLLKFVSHDLADLDELYHKVKDFSEDFAPDVKDEEEPPELEDISISDEPPSDAPVEEQQNQGQPQSSDEDSEADAAGVAEAADAAGAEADAESSSSPSEDAASSNSEGNESDMKSESDSDSDSGDGGGPSSGQGKGKGNGGKLATLNTLAVNPKIFKSILRHAYDFGEKLMVRPSYKASDEGLIDRTLTFGTDLSRLPASELGRLGNEHAKLSFLVDLANGNLLQYVDLDPRRGPLVLMLDCSGSMRGKYYEIAAGFCLAMIHMLHKAKRGVMLIKFSSGIDSIHVWDKGQPSPTLSDLLKALVTPSLSGTDFDEVTQECFRQVTKLQWKNAQGLLISDGEGTISEATVAKKPTDLKLTAILTTKKVHLKGYEEIIHASRNGLMLELTAVGNALM